MSRSVDFDFNHISVPFGMRPGLHRLADAATPLTWLDPGSRLYAEKRAVFLGGESRHTIPSFDARPALQAIAGRAPEANERPSGATQAPELLFEEDLAVLDGATGTLPWLCVCVPSHWAPEDKLGLDFAAVHAPVADNAALLRAAGQLLALATGGSCWERHVWTITPSGRYDQHPRRHQRSAWPATADPAAFADQCWLRAERQTFFPVGQGTRQAVFTIRVMLEPLPEAVTAPWQAERLRDALASMSPAVLQYKNLAAAREPLLRWLDWRVRS